jgi:glycine cleavage system H protein
MTYPEELKYTKEHEWIKIDGAHCVVGVTSYAIEQLGDVVYLELPNINSEFDAHDSFGTIESTKTVSDLYIPVKCKITAVNQSVVENPDLLTKDAYKEGWLVKGDLLGDASADLLTASQYQEYIKTLG